MPENSIHNPSDIENETTSTTFPRSGDNFVTLGFLPEATNLAAWAEAHTFVEDCQIALQAFKAEQNSGE